MKWNVTKKNTLTLSGITQEEYEVMSRILNRANDTCFGDEQQQGDGYWYSSDDFVVALSDNERKALREICKVI